MQLAHLRRGVALGGLALLCGIVPAVLSSSSSASGGSDWTAYVVDSGDGTVTPIDVASGLADLPITVGPSNSTPWTLAFSPDGETAYVVLRLPFTSSGEVVPINVQTSTTGAPIPVGENPWGIAVTPDGSTAYVTNSGASTVTPIDLADGTAGTPISLPAGSGPRGIAISPDGSTAYVADYSTDQVTPIALSTGTVEAGIDVGSQPEAIAVTPDGSFVDVADYGGGTVTPIATATKTAGTPIPVGHNPAEIALAPDGSTAYVTDYNDGGFTPIDLVTQQAGTEVVGVASAPMGIAVSPDGSTVYVSDFLDAQVVPVTLASVGAGSPIGVGTLPSAVVIDPVAGILAPDTATTTTVPPSTAPPPAGPTAAGPTTLAGTTSTTSVPTTTVPARRATPAVHILSSTVRASSHHVKLELSCTGARCSGTVTLSADIAVRSGKGHKKHTTKESVDIASASYSIAKSRDKTIKLKLTARGSRLLDKKRAHPLVGHVTISVHGGKATSRTLRMS